MVFKSFSANLIGRLLLITVSITISCECVIKQYYLPGLLFTVTSIIITYQLYKFLMGIQQKLNTFLDGIKYSDFTLHFAKDNDLGENFKLLNTRFNEIFNAFRKTREEKEENIQYLNTIVQHVSVGIISFDAEANIGIFNNALCRMLKIPKIKHLSALEQSHPALTSIFKNIKPGNNEILKENSDQEFAIFATEIRLKGKIYKLISLQDIYLQLQMKELEAWQNLSRVLRHEIMNSVTPIASLVSTLQQISENELREDIYSDEVVEDIRSGLKTVEARCKGLLSFVNAYQDFTNIPHPKLEFVSVNELLLKVIKLMQSDSNKSITISSKVTPADLQFFVDVSLIEMVLINVIKNAKEAIQNKNDGLIEISAYMDQNSHVMMEISDNGPGILKEAMNHIFTPFYTSKKNGSGIGLALSRQIMLLHNGSIYVQSVPHVKTVFTMKF